MEKIMIKICQDQTRSNKTKQDQSNDPQAYTAKTNHENAEPQKKGAAVSRRMTSSIKIVKKQ